MNSPMGLIARREIVTRWQQKGYRISLGVTLLIAVVAVILPSFFSDDGSRTTYDVGIVASTDFPRLTDGIRLAEAAAGTKLTPHDASAAEARAKVSAGDWDAALLPGPVIVVEHSGDAVVGVLRNAVLISAAAPQTGPVAIPRVQVEALTSGDDTQRQTLSIITVIVLFSQLVTFCTWVATGVVEEKSSRVVELILSSVRPIQLLAGKLLGIGALAAGQVALLGGAALVAATSAGTLTLPASALLTVLVSFVAFLLGFAFFSALSAALASTVSRQEEVSGVLAPVSILIMICYFAAFTVTTSDPSAFGRVISIVPPMSSIAMPARIARGEASVTDVVAAVVLLVVVTLGALVLAGRIYRASVLHTGSRLKLRQAWRGEEVAATPR